MIHLVDKALEQFLRRDVPLPERAADISFQPPDRDWGAGITRPTVNAFLWDAARAQGHTSSGMQQRVSPANGAVERKQATPVVTLHYLITAWASELRDEHQLLGAVLESVLANSSLPSDLLPDQAEGSTWSLSLATDDRRLPNEFWSSIGGALKPGLQVQVTVPIDVFAWRPAGPPAERIEVGVIDTTSAPGSGTEKKAEPETPETTVQYARRRSNGALVMEGKKLPSAPGGE